MRYETAKQLGIFRVLEVLKDHAQPAPLEALQVHIAFSGCAGQVSVTVERLTDINQTFGRIIAQLHLRSPENGFMRQIQYLANTFNHLDVQLRKVFPMVCVYLPENINIIIEVRGLAVIGDKRLQMFSSPIYGIVYLDRVYLLWEFIGYGHRHPLPSPDRLDTVAILPFVFFILDIVQKTEDIGFIHFVDIPQPREILRLVNGSDQ